MISASKDGALCHYLFSKKGLFASFWDKVPAFESPRNLEYLFMTTWDDERIDWFITEEGNAFSVVLVHVGTKAD